MTDNAAQRRHEDILKLISLYKQSPCLYETNGTNVHERRIAFEKIAKKMKCSTFDVKNKMKNLRAQFRREVHRMERLNTKRAKWLYYEPMKFLIPTIKYYEESMRHSNMRVERERSVVSHSDLDFEDGNSTMDENPITSNDDESQQHDTSKELLLNISIDGNHTGSDTESQDQTNNFDVKKKSNRKRIIVINRPKSEERDEFAIFGEHVANELRQLENHKSLQQSLKCSILQSILSVNQANIDSTTEEDYTEETYLEEYI